MGYINNRHPSFYKRLNDVEKLLQFMSRQDRRGLIHHDQICILRKGFGNFNHLLKCHAEITDFCIQVNLQT